MRIKTTIILLSGLSCRLAVVNGGNHHSNAVFVSGTQWQRRLWRCRSCTDSHPVLNCSTRTEAAAGEESSVPNISTKTRRSWEESYELLCAYKEKHGHHDISQSERPLGPWINRQRIEHAKYLLREEMIRNKDININIVGDKKLPSTSMTSHRKKLLDEFGFVWDAMGQTWDTRYDEL